MMCSTHHWGAAFINVARAIRGYRFMPPGMGLLIRLVRIFRALRTAPFDVLDVMQVTPDGVYAACFWRGPLMLDFWGSDIYRLSARSWWIRRLMPRVVRKADRIHAMSEHMARTLVALGADASRTEAFQYGIDFAQFGFGAAPRTSQEIIATRNRFAAGRTQQVIGVLALRQQREFQALAGLQTRHRHALCRRRSGRRWTASPRCSGRSAPR